MVEIVRPPKNWLFEVIDLYEPKPEIWKYIVDQIFSKRNGHASIDDLLPEKTLEITRDVIHAQAIFDEVLMNGDGMHYFSGCAADILGIVDIKGTVEETPRSKKLAKSLSDFLDEPIAEDFGKSFLRGYARSGHNLSDEELEKYRLIRIFNYTNVHFGNSDGKDDSFDGRYYDGVFNFSLCYDGKLVASLGFVAQKGGVLITQIQGSEGRSDVLAPIKWERALVDYAVDWARQHGIPEIAILGVENNIWAKMTFDKLKSKGFYEDEVTFDQATKMDSIFILEKARREETDQETYVPLLPHQGFMLYNVTAKRSGFKQGEDGNFVLHLSPK